MRAIIIFVLLALFQTGCSDLLVQPPDTNQNLADFEYAWKVINDVYPLFEYKKINWDSIYTVYRLRTEKAKGDEFYQVLFDLLGELKDPHVYFLNKGRGVIFPYPGVRFIRDRNAYSPLVVRKYFDTELQLACRDKGGENK